MPDNGCADPGWVITYTSDIRNTAMKELEKIYDRGNLHWFSIIALISMLLSFAVIVYLVSILLNWLVKIGG